MRIQIQGFDDQKLEKIVQLKKFCFLDQKLQFTDPQGLHKGIQITGEIFIPQKRTSSNGSIQLTKMNADPQPVPMSLNSIKSVRGASKTSDTVTSSCSARR
jgi:hypothetical protein